MVDCQYCGISLDELSYKSHLVNKHKVRDSWNNNWRLYE